METRRRELKRRAAFAVLVFFGFAILTGLASITRALQIHAGWLLSPFLSAWAAQEATAFVFWCVGAGLLFAAIRDKMWVVREPYITDSDYCRLVRILPALGGVMLAAWSFGFVDAADLGRLTLGVLFTSMALALLPSACTLEAVRSEPDGPTPQTWSSLVALLLARPSTAAFLLIAVIAGVVLTGVLSRELIAIESSQDGAGVTFRLRGEEVSYLPISPYVWNRLDTRVVVGDKLSISVSGHVSPGIVQELPWQLIETVYDRQLRSTQDVERDDNRAQQLEGKDSLAKLDNKRTHIWEQLLPPREDGKTDSETQSSYNRERLRRAVLAVQRDQWRFSSALGYSDSDYGQLISHPWLSRDHQLACVAAIRGTESDLETLAACANEVHPEVAQRSRASDVAKEPSVKWDLLWNLWIQKWNRDFVRELHANLPAEYCAERQIPAVDLLKLDRGDAEKLSILADALQAFYSSYTPYEVDLVLNVIGKPHNRVFLLIASPQLSETIERALTERRQPPRFLVDDHKVWYRDSDRPVPSDAGGKEDDRWRGWKALVAPYGQLVDVSGQLQMGGPAMVEADVSGSLWVIINDVGTVRLDNAGMLFMTLRKH